jgi:hypothetical protein
MTGMWVKIVLAFLRIFSQTNFARLLLYQNWLRLLGKVNTFSDCAGKHQTSRWVEVILGLLWIRKGRKQAYMIEQIWLD